jgi:hypothetical protein
VPAQVEDAPKRSRKKKEEPAAAETVVARVPGVVVTKTDSDQGVQLAAEDFAGQMQSIDDRQQAEIEGAPSETEVPTVTADEAPLLLPSGRQTDLGAIHSLLTSPPLLTGPDDGDLLSTVNPKTRMFPDSVLTRLLYLSPVAVLQREHPEPAKYAPKLPPPAEALLPLATIDTQGVEDFLAVLQGLQASPYPEIPIIGMNLSRGVDVLRGRIQAKFTEIAERLRAAQAKAAQKQGAAS